MRGVDGDYGTKTVFVPDSVCEMWMVTGDSGTKTLSVPGSVCEVWIVTLVLRLSSFQAVYARCGW